MLAVAKITALQDTRSRLIAAAGEIFAENGFDRATVREITEQAGVNIAAINYHFRDKAELYAACLREAKCTAIEAAGEWVTESDAPEARLRQFIDRMVRRLLNPDKPAWHHRLLNREIAQPTGALDQMVEEGIRPDCVLLENILLELTEGRISRERRILMGFSVVAQCLFLLQNRPIIERLYPEFRQHPPKLESVVEHIFQFSLTAIRSAQ